MPLRDDCELWATFDAEDVDSARGIVRDRSGKGRTLEASGGPTYGQSSPVGEGVGFDGTDDRFDTNNAESNAGVTEWTIAQLCRWDGGNSGSGKYTVMHGGFVAFTNHDATDTYKTQFSTPSGIVTVKDSGFGRENEWVVLVSTFNSGNARLFVNGKLVEVSSTTETSLADKKPTELTVGHTVNDTVPFSGDIGFTAEWSRALSDAEIEELTRMTDRMVSRL